MLMRTQMTRPAPKPGLATTIDPTDPLEDLKRRGSSAPFLFAPGLPGHVWRPKRIFARVNAAEVTPESRDETDRWPGQSGRQVRP